MAVDKDLQTKGAGKVHSHTCRQATRHVGRQTGMRVDKQAGTRAARLPSIQNAEVVSFLKTS